MRGRGRAARRGTDEGPTRDRRAGQRPTRRPSSASEGPTRDRPGTDEWHRCSRRPPGVSRRRLDLAGLQPGDRLVALGDAIDRGPDSVEVIALLRTNPDAVWL